MRPSFYPRLVNGPFGDPSLYVAFLFEKQAMLFDLGDISALSSRAILKTDHVFITHTHIDHFIGFDRLLRLFIGRNKTLYLYGPAGILANLEGKLAAYTWNLVDHYENSFVLAATEVHPTYLIEQRYVCSERFLPTHPPKQRAFNGFLLQTPTLSVKTAILDHGIPCLGFALKERFHVNINKESLRKHGFVVGPWLKTFKQALFDDPNLENPETTVDVPIAAADVSNRPTIQQWQLGDLAREIAMITPGQKIVYLADIIYHASNKAGVVSLARNADVMFIEAAFLEKDRNVRGARYHLTAKQSGELAALAGVKNFTLFHFSPRYRGMERLLTDEAGGAMLNERTIQRPTSNIEHSTSNTE